MDKKTGVIIFLGVILLLGLGFLARAAWRGGEAGMVFSRGFEEIKPRKDQAGVSAAPAADKTPAKEAKPVLCEVSGEPSRDSVIINELAWMGSVLSYTDEWIELKNISGAPVDIGAWQMQNKKKKIKIFFPKNTVIPAGGLFLMERTDDDSAPGVKADLVYSGTLANENESLHLLDKECRLRDSASAAPKWPAGDNVLKLTMERKADLFWQASKGAGGTPKAENSAGKQASIINDK